MNDHASPITATLIGVPINVGANNLGVDFGPNAYRYQNIIPKLASAGIQTTDAGNIFCEERWKVDVGPNPRLRFVHEVVRIANDTAKLVQETIEHGDTPIVVGGDHTTCLGAVSGASVAVKGNIGLIYFDAHGDMNTDQTSPSGNIHGMQLASLMGFGAHELTSVHADTTKVAKENMLHIGGCDFDQTELDLVARQKLNTFSMQDLMSHGMAPLFPMIDALAKQVENVWISIDLDSIDVTYAPGAGMPNKKGLLYREVLAMTQYIGQHCNVLGVDVVEYNPLQDPDKKTADLATELIAALLGKEYSWYSSYLSRNA
jgi:arginase